MCVGPLPHDLVAKVLWLEDTRASDDTAEEEPERRLDETFKAQLSREREELEAEDAAAASNETAEDGGPVATSNEARTAGADLAPGRSREIDADSDGLAWENDLESLRHDMLEM